MSFPQTAKRLDTALSTVEPISGLMFLTSFLGLAVFMLRPIVSSILAGGSHRSTNDQKPLIDNSLPRPTTLDLGPPLRAADHADDGKHHLLLAATGSVATIKIPNIVQALSKHDNLSIRILLSESAAKFLQSQSLEQPALSQIAGAKNVDGIYCDVDEWSKPWVRGDSILHIELRRWADLMVIAPLSANSLAKIAQGLSDNLINSVIRAWDATGMIDAARPGIRLPYADGAKKGIMVAPAMNTAMWHHPLTAEHLKRLEEDWAVQNGGWFEVLRPIEKELACGDTGSGAMHDWKLIVVATESRLGFAASDNL